MNNLDNPLHLRINTSPDPKHKKERDFSVTLSHDLLKKTSVNTFLQETPPHFAKYTLRSGAPASKTVSTATFVQEQFFKSSVSSVTYEEKVAIKHAMANIHGDFFIGNSHFEGWRQDEAAQYLIRGLGQYIQEQRKKIETLSKQSSQQIKSKYDIHSQLTPPFLESLEKAFLSLTNGLPVFMFLGELFNSPAEIRNNPTNRSNYFNLIRSVITRLEINASVLLPGGWAGIPYGHHVYYEVTKLEATRYRFKIYNSGAGINFHQQAICSIPGAQNRAPRSAIIYLPSFEITNIEERRLLDDSLLQVLYEMMTLVSFDDSLTSYNGKDIYERFLPLLGGRVVEPSGEAATKLESYILPQHSGSCSWSGFMAMLREKISIGDYERFIHFIHKFSLTDFFRRIYRNLDDLKDDEEACILLRRIAEQFSGDTLRRYNLGFISLDEVEDCNKISRAALEHEKEAAGLYLKMRSDLMAKKERVDFRVIERGMLLECIQPDYETYSFKQDIGHTSRSLRMLWDQVWKVNAANIDQELNKIYLDCSKAMSDEPYAVAHYIRRLFSQLPMPVRVSDPFWSLLTESQVNACMEHIVNLSELAVRIYGQIHSKEHSMLRTALIIGLYKCYAIQHKLASSCKQVVELNYENCNFAIDEIQNCFSSESSKEFYTFASSNRGDANIYDYNLLLQLREVEFYFRNPSNDGPSFFNFSYFDRMQGSYASPTPDDRTTYRESLFVYRYTSNHYKSFTESMDTGFKMMCKELELKIAFSDPLQACATYAMSDLDAKFLPLSFCRLKRQFLIFGGFLYGQIITPKKDLIENINPFSLIKTHDGPAIITRNSLIETPASVLPRRVNDQTHIYWQHDQEGAENSPLLSILNHVRGYGNFKEIAYDDSLSKEEGRIFQCLLSRNEFQGGRNPQELQVIKALDYFSSHMSRLDEINFQSFLKRVFFTGDYLTLVLKNNVTMGNRFISFLQRGYSFFLERRNISGAIFFIYLKQLFQERLLASSSTCKTIHEIQENFSKAEIDAKQHLDIPDALKQLLEIAHTPIEKVLVYRQLIYCFGTQDEKRKKEFYPLIATAFTFIRANPLPYHLHDRNLDFIMERIRLLIMIPQLRTLMRSEESTKIISSVAQALGYRQPAKDCTWEQIKLKYSAPICTGSINGKEICSFNTDEFIFKDAHAPIAFLPLQITTHPHFTRNFSNQHMPCYIMGEGRYEFNDSQGRKIRIAQLSSSQIKIQRQFSLNGKFYEFIPELSLGNDLPHTLMGRTHWLGVEANHYFSCISEKPDARQRSMLFCLPGTSEVTHVANSFYGTRFTVIDCATRMRLATIATALFSSLNEILFDIEPRKHIHVLADNGYVRRIEFPRLGLNFVIEKDSNNKLQARCLEERGFSIAFNKHLNSLNGFNNYILLKNVAGVKKVIIPRKPVESRWNRRFVPNIALSNVYIPTNSRNVPQYFSYYVNAQDDLSTTNEEGNLFIAYLLIAQKRYFTALKYLRAIKKRTRFSQSELEIFSWMKFLHPKESPDPRSVAIFLIVTAMRWEDYYIHGRGNRGLYLTPDPDEEIREIYQIYQSYNILINQCADLLLTPEEERSLLLVFADHLPHVEFIFDRLSVLNEGIQIAPRFNFINARPNWKGLKIDVQELLVFLQIFNNRIPQLTSLLTRPPEIRIDEEFNKIRTISPKDVDHTLLRLDTLSRFNPKHENGYQFLKIVALYPNLFPANWKGMQKLIDGHLKGVSFDLADLVCRSIRLHHKLTFTVQKEKEKEKTAAAAKAFTSRVITRSNYLTVLQKQSQAISWSTSINKEAAVKKRLQDIAENAGGFQKREKERFNADVEKSLHDTHLKLNISVLNNRAQLLKYLSNEINRFDGLRKKEEAETKIVEKELLALANKETAEKTGKEDQDFRHRLVSTTHQSEILALHKRPLTINDLCVCALNQDSTSFLNRNPNLSSTDIDRLRHLLTSFLVHATNAQRYSRKVEAFENMKKYAVQRPRGEDLTQNSVVEELMEKMARVSLEQRSYPPIDNCHFLIFEYHTGISLRLDQVEAIQSLHSSPYMIQQIIMGSGKTKVLLPILALLEARPDRISVIVLPQAMYETTTRDLQQTLGDAFNRAVHTLSFTRNTEFTITKLNHIFEFLLKIRSKQECLVMTSKSLQCILLKFKEAVIALAGSPNNKELLEKVTLLQQILLIFKTGRAIIDEADQILNCRLEVNFSLGELKSLHQSRYHLTRTLYEQMCLHPSLRKIGKGNLIANFAELAPIYHQQIKPLLLKATLEAYMQAGRAGQSPFGQYLLRLLSEHREIITAYLLSEESENSRRGEECIAARFKAAHDNEERIFCDLLALLKEQLHVLSPLTLNKTFYVQYGPSKKTVTNGENPWKIAKPYSGNNTPIEPSDFGNPHEQMNYTIQMHWLMGFPENEIRIAIRNLQAKAALEISENSKLSYDQTVAFREFRHLCGKELSEISLMSCSAEDITRITMNLNSNRLATPQRFFDFMEQYVLSAIKIQTKKIASNPLDLINMFGSAVGFTGTPGNYDTFPEPLRENTVRVTGIDGKTVTILLRKTASQNGIAILDTSSDHVMITQLLKAGPDALIDTGAIFHGRSNETVARLLLNHLGRNKAGVVFFQNNVAMVLERIEGMQPRLIPFSACHLAPEQRFTYYDHSHTTGADISQHHSAHACLTINKDVTFRDLCQGTWRMREIDKQQNISFVVTPETIKIMNVKGENVTCSQILDFVREVQLSQQKDQIIVSAKQKIENIVRRTLQDILLRINFKNPTIQQALPEVLKDLSAVIETQFQDAPFISYGRRNVLINREDAIKLWKERPLRNFQRLLNHPYLFGAPDDMSPKEYGAWKMEQEQHIERLMDHSLQVIINLLPGQLYSSQVSKSDIESMVEIELETLRQQLVQQQLAEILNYPRESWWEGIYENRFEHVPKIFSENAYQLVSYQQPELTIGEQKLVFDLGDIFRNCPQVALREFAALANGIIVTKNRLPRQHPTIDILTITQIPMQYLLFMRHKSNHSLHIILLDAPSDFAFFWEALSLDQAELYPSTERSLELCLTNIHGDIIQTDSTVNIDDLTQPFPHALRTHGMALRTQAKLLLGEIYFSHEEELCLQQMIKHHGIVCMRRYAQYVLERHPWKRQLFPQSTLGRILS